MEKGYEEKYHAFEENNWWFQSRRHTILSMIENLPKDSKIIDIGCSGGVLLNALKSHGFSNITGIDFSPEAIDKCKKNNISSCFIMDAHNPDFKDETFDLAIVSDCMEHLKDDEIALKNWNRILKKGGQAIIFVPAFMSLWSDHDTVNYHFRRYTKKELIDKSIRSGFLVSKSSYWNFLMFFPVYIFRKLKNVMRDTRKKPEDNLQHFNPFSNYILKSWLSIENIFFKLWGLPVGVSVMVTLKKNE